MSPGSPRVSHALELRGLSKRYGDHIAIADVTIEVRQGRFVTLLGPSGSGKTTILMAVAGFVIPDHGEILLDGRSILALPPERRNFGMVFQGYALFPEMTVEENVWFPLRVRGLRRAAARNAVAAALDLVQMGPFAGRRPHQLSGGQQQRVALARALVFEPHLLLLDEPLSALDKRLRADLQWELKSLHRRLGSTFLNVTHDQEEALSMSDEVVILRDGRVEQAGSPGDLYERPASRFVAGFLGESNFLTGKIAGAEQGSFCFSCGAQLLRQAGAPPAGLRDGTVTIALRPEKVMASRERPGSANVVAGTISEFSYLGANFVLQVETESVGRVRVRATAAQLGFLPEMGAVVWLGWEPDAGVLVADR